MEHDTLFGGVKPEQREHYLLKLITWSVLTHNTGAMLCVHVAVLAQNLWS